MKTKLNITALIDDLGGVANAAKIAGVVRTAPYGWMRRQYLSSVVLEKIKAAYPDLDLDKYFEEIIDDQDELSVGDRISA